MPTKVGLFVCEVWWGKILTTNQLKKMWFFPSQQVPFLWVDGRSLGAFFYPLPLDLGLVDYLILSLRRWMGLSLPGYRAAYGLGLSSSQEKRSKVVAGSSPFLVVGNLD